MFYLDAMRNSEIEKAAKDYKELMNELESQKLNFKVE
jgi:hypothetical protein